MCARRVRRWAPASPPACGRREDSVATHCRELQLERVRRLLLSPRVLAELLLTLATTRTCLLQERKSCTVPPRRRLGRAQNLLMPCCPWLSRVKDAMHSPPDEATPIAASEMVPQQILGEWTSSFAGHNIHLWDTGDGRIRFSLNDGLVIGLLRPTEELDDHPDYKLSPVGQGWFEGPLVDCGGFGWDDGCCDWPWAAVRWHKGQFEMRWGPWQWEGGGRARGSRETPWMRPDKTHVRKTGGTWTSYTYLVNAILTSETIFLKGRWLTEWAATGKPLPRRQELPEDAYWDNTELARHMQLRGDVPFIALS